MSDKIKTREKNPRAKTKRVNFSLRKKKTSLNRTSAFIDKSPIGNIMESNFNIRYSYLDGEKRIRQKFREKRAKASKIRLSVWRREMKEKKNANIIFYRVLGAIQIKITIFVLADRHKN